jgi:hypothetical protein
MAIPTITSITPNSGLTRGKNLVNIVGTGFVVAGFPDFGSGITKPLTTIKVKVGGRLSTYAYAVTETTAIAKIPEWRGDYKDLDENLALDFWLANLDENGDEIPGENVTVAGGYSVHRKALVGSTVVENVLREFMKYLRRHIHPNVWLTTERLYSDADDVPDRIRTATSPLIHINGVVEDYNALAQPVGVQEFDVVGDDTVFNVLEPPTTVDLVMSNIMVYSNEKHISQILGLSHAFQSTLRNNPFLFVDAPAWDLTEGEYEYAMRLDDQPEFDVEPTGDGLKSFKVGITIESVDVMDGIEQRTDEGHTVEAADSPEIDWRAT